MTEADNGTDRLAGGVLVGASFLAFLAMTHHPTSVHGTGVGGYVHGAMIVLVSALFFGFARFSARRGLGRAPILAGLVAYAVSVAAHIAAATINGAIVPALAAEGHGAVGHDTFRLCWEANQAVAQLGVNALGLAYLLFSVDLVLRGRAEDRLLGAAGIATGLGPALALATGLVALDVEGAMIVYAVHGLWAALVGVQLLRGRL